MAQAAVAANFNQPLDIHLNFAAKIAFDFVILGNELTKSVRSILSQILNPDIRIDFGVRQDPIVLWWVQYQKYRSTRFRYVYYVEDQHLQFLPLIITPVAAYVLGFRKSQTKCLCV